MEKLISLVMYLLWTLAIIAVLATTFTNFQHEDLNILSAVLFFFAAINSFFSIHHRK